MSKKKERKKNKQINRAEQNPKLEEPDPSRPTRGLSSESQHVNKDSQKSACRGARAHRWKWVLHHLSERHIKATECALRLEHQKCHFIPLLIWSPL